MQRHGFIHDLLDVKILILFITARTKFPLSKQDIYELCFQDDGLSYIDVFDAIPKLVASGHLQQLEGDLYVITEKGRDHGAVTENDIAFTVRRKAEDAVEKYDREHRRQNKINTQLLERENGEYGVVMSLDDEFGALMKLELLATDQRQAIQLAKRFEKHADLLYDLMVTTLWDDTDT
ncbi:MAG: DUF4364 family protein [Oscillospiraceae bacterium]|nr:DUF4364 family protein [Oscillospiraceae bacterium]